MSKNKLICKYSNKKTPKQIKKVNLIRYVRTLDDVKGIIKHAKLDERNLTQVTQVSDIKRDSFLISTEYERIFVMKLVF